MEELHELYRDRPYHEPGYVSPDITVTDRAKKKIAFEVENDIQWDLGASLRQVKKYNRISRTREIEIILPSEYKRFAPLYLNKRIQVYLWTANRIWQC